MRSRWIIVVLALVAAIAFCMSVQGARWWTVDDVTTIGPFGAKHCFGGECKNTGLAWIGGTDRWMRTGKAAGAACLLSALLLLLVAGATAAKRFPKLAVRTALVSLATTAIAGILFFAQFPGVENAHLDRGVYLFVAAVIAGLAAMLLVNRAAPVQATER